MHIGVIIAIMVVIVAIFAVVLMYVFSGTDDTSTTTTTTSSVPITTTVPVTDTTTGAQTTVPVTTQVPVTTTTTTTVQPPTFADGSIIRSPDGKIFVVHGGKRYHFTAVSYAACGSPKFTNYPQATVDAFPAGAIQVPSCASKSADASAARSVLTSAGY